MNVVRSVLLQPDRVQVRPKADTTYCAATYRTALLFVVLVQFAGDRRQHPE